MKTFKKLILITLIFGTAKQALNCMSFEEKVSNRSQRSTPINPRTNSSVELSTTSRKLKSAENRELQLYLSQFSEKLRPIIRQIKNGETILVLRSMQINDDEATEIAQALKYSNVRRLDISSNEIGIIGTQEIINSLALSKIEYLNISNNPVKHRRNINFSNNYRLSDGYRISIDKNISIEPTEASKFILNPFPGIVENLLANDIIQTLYGLEEIIHFHYEQTVREKLRENKNRMSSQN